MADISIKSDPFDTEFRRIVAEHIVNAQKSIKIVTGEISAYDYLDLRNPAEDAADRGVKIEVYAVQPKRDIINRLIHNNIDVYIGKKDLEEHFMIVDDNKVVVSFKDKERIIPTPVGDHRGLIVQNPEQVEKYIQMFNALKEKAHKQKIEGLDPLLRALKNPLTE